MCGIAGFLWRNHHQSPEALADMARQMGKSIYHRGPDSGDVWVEVETGLGLSHRRLAIIDLSEAGAQPMTSACGRYVLIYNGEVYNAAELRPELEAKGITFRGHSDTEVIVEGCAAWGVRATVERLIGMFALALWDRKERTLSLVRDRLGIKPLYWSNGPEAFLFGSELKALRVHPACPHEVNRNAAAAFLRHNYVPSPCSIYQDIQKLEPGCILTLAWGREPWLDRYWALEQVVKEAQDSPFAGNGREAVEALDNLLFDAVRRRMMADVPLGAFLSGGIDSSTVAALMQANSSKPIRTFSIGFDETGYNEAVHAAAVAKYLGTEHTELYVTPDEARAVIPHLADYYDEPFADSSQIPTYLVSKMTREHVTVALSGDGGDELFGGYTRYFAAQNYKRLAGGLPKPLRLLMAEGLKRLSPTLWDRLFALAPKRFCPSQPGDKLHKLANVLHGDVDDFYRRLISHWDNPGELVIGGQEPKGLIWDGSVHSLVPDLVDRMQYLDTLTYLPDDILTKVDRASMAVSLEARVPILDHRVVAFAWSLPQSLKVRRGRGKWLLRQVLYRHVPQDLVERPKMGFGVPIGNWLCGPLREWAEDLLSENNLKAQGLLSPQPIREKWQEHLSGARNWQYLLWDVLMLQSWCRRWL